MAISISGTRLLFHDLALGREVNSIDLKPEAGRFYAGFDAAGHVLINTGTGCYRLPVRPDVTTPGTLEIGPPEADDTPRPRRMGAT
jgi:hypothetical protein